MIFEDEGQSCFSLQVCTSSHERDELIQNKLRRLIRVYKTLRSICGPHMSKSIEKWRKPRSAWVMWITTDSLLPRSSYAGRSQPAKMSWMRSNYHPQSARSGNMISTPTTSLSSIQVTLHLANTHLYWKRQKLSFEKLCIYLKKCCNYTYSIQFSNVWHQLFFLIPTTYVMVCKRNDVI